MTIEWLLAPAAAIAAAGAVLDIRTRRLPNWLCAAFAVSAAAGLALASGLDALPSAGVHAVIALAVGVALFRARIVGGGDAKFYAAAACGLPLAQALPLLAWTSAAGLVMWLAMFVARMIATRSMSLRGWDIPYGVAIFVGFVLATQFSRFG